MTDTFPALRLVPKADAAQKAKDFSSKFPTISISKTT